jgi:hypothetical protein
MCRSILLFFFLIHYAYAGAQSFGIGVDSPDPNAILEIQSTNRGILIPRLTTVERNTNLAALTIAQRGLMIYNTTDDEFNYWDGVQWIPFPGTAVPDSDWEVVTGGMHPYTIDNNVSVGTTAFSGRFNVFTDYNQPTVHFEGINDQPNATGIRNNLLNATNGGQGIYQDIGGLLTGTSPIYGIYNNMSNVFSNGLHITSAMTNKLSGSGSSEVYGIQNIFDGSQDGNKYGVHTAISGLGGGSHYGTFNEITSTDNGPKFGIRNDITGVAADYAYGAYNRIFGAINNQSYGNVNILNVTGGAANWGTYNSIDASGSGNNMGVQNVLSGSGVGSYYGVHNTLNGTGSGNPRYGVYNILDGDVNDPSGDRFGIYNELTGANNGIHYGNYHSILNSGTGLKYGNYTYFDAAAAGTLYGNYIEMASAVNTIKYGTYYTSSLGTLGTQVANYTNMDGSSTNAKFGYYYQSAVTTSGQQRAFNAVVNGAPGAIGLIYGYFSTVLSTIGGTHYGTATGANGPNHYGIYAENTNAAGWAGYFQGNVTVTGTFNPLSDIQFKTDIKPLPSALSKILKLQPKSYLFKPDLAEIWGFPRDFQAGLIAQDVERVIPHLVSNDSHTPRNLEKEIDAEEIDKPTSYKSVNYIGLIPYLIKAIQEQQAMIEEKEDTILRLQTKLSNIEERLQKLEQVER